MVHNRECNPHSVHRFSLSTNNFLEIQLSGLLQLVICDQFSNTEHKEIKIVYSIFLDGFLQNYTKDTTTTQ